MSIKKITLFDGTIVEEIELLCDPWQMDEWNLEDHALCPFCKHYTAHDPDCEAA